MIVLTDDQNFADSSVGRTHKWRSGFPELLSENMKFLAGKLINKKVYHTTTDEFPSWNYLVAVNHAADSQFEILKHAVNEKPGLGDKIICLAGSGKNFKGYRNRSWISLPGNLHFCALLKPNQAVLNFHVGFTILSAISVIETLDDIPGFEGKALIKWVNDILINNDKISGVLTQTQTIGENVSSAIIGIGLNITQTPRLVPDIFNRKATSLNDHISDKTLYNLAFILNRLQFHLNKNYTLLLHGKYHYLLNIYRQKSAILLKKIEIYSDPHEGEAKKLHEGVVAAIGENLELILENNDQPVVRGKVVF